jgi:hypothetical protein
VLFALFPIVTMAATPTPSPAQSGIEGVILVSPSHPGPVRKDSPGPAPARNITFVVMRGEVRAASLTTDSEGRFQALLPPGQYVVLREDPGARIGHWRFEVEVKPGEMTKVQWVGDSGMR